MAKGISITITRTIETRAPRNDERYHTIWNDGKRLTLSLYPRPPSMVSYNGGVPEVVTTRLEFLPPNIVSQQALEYRRSDLYKKITAGEFGRAANGRGLSPSTANVVIRDPIKEGTDAFIKDARAWREEALANADPKVRQLLIDIGWA